MGLTLVVSGLFKSDVQTGADMLGFDRQREFVISALLVYDMA